MRSGFFPTPCSPWEPVYPLRHRLPFLLCALLLAAPPGLRAAHPQKFSDFTTPLPLARGETLVIGVVGAWQHWDTDHNLVRRVSNHLRLSQVPGLHAETVENHRLGLARQLIEKAFDFNRDGRLDDDEKKDVRLVLYGHSLGAAKSVGLCRWLQKRQVPVRLAVLIDSVGFRDGKMPPNVQAAANLFQHDFGPLQGQSKIRAQDPAKTEILGNFRFHYPAFKLLPALDAPLKDNLLQIPHRKMEFDPAVWLKVESLILATLIQ